MCRFFSGEECICHRGHREHEEEKIQIWFWIQIDELCVLCVLCGYYFWKRRLRVRRRRKLCRLMGQPFVGSLVSIDGGGRVTFRESDGTKKDGAVRTLSLEELVRWGNPVSPRAQTMVVLADGGRIVTAADWSGGATVKLVGGDLVVASDMWDEVRLPRRLVSGIVFAQQRRAEDREKLVERVRGEPSQKEMADVGAADEWRSAYGETYRAGSWVAGG